MAAMECGQLSLGSLPKIQSGDYLEPVVIQASFRDLHGQANWLSAFLAVSHAQIMSMEKNGSKYRATFSDGQSSGSAVLASQLSTLVEAGALKVGTIAKISNYSINQVNGSAIIIASELEVISQDENMAAAAATPAAAAKTPGPASGGGKAAAVVTLGGSATRAPLAGLHNTPGPLPSPSEE